MNTDYANKPESYYGVVRWEIVDRIPGHTKTMLDVGCGYGDTGVAAKSRLGEITVVGLEYFEPAAEVASKRLDRVYCGDVESMDLDFPDGHFDCIVCADVLEHTRDPWLVLSRLRTKLAPSGVLVVSLPNIRNMHPLWDILRDRFEYQDHGILDRTHLRFFTLHTMRKMLESTGFEITSIGHNRYHSWKYNLLVGLTLGLLYPFTIYQHLFTCVAKDG
jgi:2-polyprenyl-3-methyl-5-hydroxy-6-metoxy-1,4-benzoquinol methylase